MKIIKVRLILGLGLACLFVAALFAGPQQSKAQHSWRRGATGGHP